MFTLMLGKSLENLVKEKTLIPTRNFVNLLILTLKNIEIKKKRVNPHIFIYICFAYFLNDV